MNNKVIENDEISLKNLLQQIKEWYSYLLSKWKIIILVGIFGAIVGLSYSLLSKPIYTATLSFVVEDEKGGGGLGGALGLAGSLGLDIGGNGGNMFSGSNLTELFKSRSMVEQTLLTPVRYNNKVISLAEMYITINKWRDNWNDRPKFKNIKFLPNLNRDYFSREHDSILGIIYSNLSQNSLSVAQKDKKNAIISIDVKSTNELFSLYFCEALAKQVGKFYVETKSKKARINMDILELQVDSVRRELNRAITGVAVANDNTFNLNPALNAHRSPSTRRQVDVQANTTILTELVKQSELAKVTLRKETPLIQVIDRPILPLSKERFGRAKGVVIGGTIGFFMIILVLIFRRLLKQLAI
ncbi:Wzz/FepE/Etk N-terminal domain-containing protein [Flavobacterium sp.]|uniref:Wzz/FepE/Etk N-terminal domain-containing protein n=1 Tax=Flavobacterium sp. TaxID=239 RepID=UPI0031E2D9FF